MQVEDSYEGAVRRLARLEHARIDVAVPRDVGSERMRDLEELASLACEENERLTRELDQARIEIERLRMQMASLQESTSANQYYEAALAATRKRGRGAAFVFFVLAIGGAAAAALFVTRPWEKARATIELAAPTPPPAPVVTPPTPTPMPTAAPAPSAPVVATPPAASAPVLTAPAPTTPTIPKVAPTIPKVAAPVESRKPKHHHAAAKHHGKSHKHGAAAHASKPAVGDTDDPLGGLNL